MRKLLLLILLIVLGFYFGGQRFAMKSGKGLDGSYRLVMVDKKSGNVTNLWGK